MGTTHEVVAETYYRTFSHRNTVLATIAPGDTVRTRTLCAGGQDFDGERRGEPGNPLTGSFYVEGAEPGDALTVRFDRVRCNRDWGWSTYRLGLIALLPEMVEHVYSSSYKADLIRPGRDNIVPWDIDVEAGVVRLREPAPQTARLEFPLKPMVGCIGVAPAGDFAPTSGPSGAYGGNIDYNEIGEGATVVLPVSHPGAYLFVGDGHALQGDGEALGTAVETSMDLEFTVGLRKGAAPSCPRVENDEALMSIGSQPEFASSLDRGLQMATSDMVTWLGTDYGLAPWEAHLLIGMTAKYEVATVAGSMVLKILRRHLPAPRA
ncbi:MAG: acetamidase/formamidase family protein [Dehalococcoidia bacterium]